MEGRHLQKIHDQVLKLAEKSAEIALKYFYLEGLEEEKKIEDGIKSIVTIADKEVSQLLEKELPFILPNSTVVSEESNIVEVGEYTWVIDPIDGTHNFSRNLDMWGISIALFHQGRPLYGLCYYPRCIDKYFYAIQGNGAYDMTGKNLHIKLTEDFKPFYSVESRNKAFKEKGYVHDFGIPLSLRKSGASLYDGYNIFKGGLSFMFSKEAAFWDVAAVYLIAKEMGYTIDTFGREFEITSQNVRIMNVDLIIAKPDIYKELSLREHFSKLEN